jgi:hypothetical protein
MSPKSFADVQKGPLDLLNQDYFFDRKLKIVTISTTGVKYTAEGIMKPKGTAGTLSAKFQPFKNVQVEKLAVGVDGRFKGEISMVDDLFKGAKLIVKAEDGGGRNNSGEAVIEFAKDSLRLDTSVNVTDGPILSGAATYEHKGVTGGFEVKYNTMLEEKGVASFEDFNGVVAYNARDYSVALKSKKKASIFNFTLLHDVNPTSTLAAEFEMNPKSGAKMLTVGGQHILDSETTVQGKINSDAIVSANLIQKVRPQVKLVFSAQIDARNFAADSHKFGMQLILG